MAWEVVALNLGNTEMLSILSIQEAKKLQVFREAVSNGRGGSHSRAQDSE